MTAKCLAAVFALLPLSCSVSATDIQSVSGSIQPKPSVQLAEALESFPSDSTRVIIAMVASGKTQTYAVAEQTKMFEEAIADLTKNPDFHVADVSHDLIGIGSGSILTAHTALGGKPSTVIDEIKDCKTKMITPRSVHCCLSCLGTSAKVAHYLLDENGEITESSSVENNYDAFKQNATNVDTIARLTTGTEYDLQTGFAVLSSSTSSDFSERVLAAINETDAAAKANSLKVGLNTILDSAKVATSAAIAVGGKRINHESANKCLNILTEGGETYTKICKRAGRILGKTVFTKSLKDSLLNPTPDAPTLLLILSATTAQTSILKTLYEQEIGDNIIKAMYTTKIPLAYYPHKSLSYDSCCTMIDSALQNCMQSSHLESAKCTDLIVNKLSEILQAKDVVASPPLAENETDEVDFLRYM